MKWLPALAGTLALFLLVSPVRAGAQTYHHDSRASGDEAKKMQVLRARHAISVLRDRVWFCQDRRHAKRSETRHLERNVHAVPRLRRLKVYWWRLAVRNERLTKAYVASLQPTVDSCLSTIISREGSGGDPHATNPTTGAYGIPQALPGSKMASAGADWATNPATQIRWMIGYVNSRYGGSCAALAHSYSYGWY